MIASIFTAVFAALPLAAAFSEGANDNVAIYWGQNSAGQEGSQKSLGYYCQSDSSDLVLVSFLNKFFDKGGLPSINLGPSCGGPTFPGSNLLSCPDVGADIQACQNSGKKVILSLGGAVGSYGFESSQQAKDFADTMWNLFAGGSSETRPFGDAKVDGFDLDIELGSMQYYEDFVKQIRSHYASDSSKKYYVSGSPQCPIPAQTTDDLDMYFVQYYNNYCGLNAYGTDDFNFAAWDKFASAANAKVFLGVPGAPAAAGSGYESADKVVSIATQLQSKYSSFGGVSIWDASQAWANDDFAGAVKRGIADSVPEVTLSTDEGKNVNPSTTFSFGNSTTPAGTPTAPTDAPAGSVIVTVHETDYTTECTTTPAAGSAVTTVEATAYTTVSCDTTTTPAPAPVETSTAAPTKEAVVTVHTAVTVTKQLPIESCVCMA